MTVVTVRTGKYAFCSAHLFIDRMTALTTERTRLQSRAEHCGRAPNSTERLCRSVYGMTALNVLNVYVYIGNV